jgi:maleylpyruvate isomerase
MTTTTAAIEAATTRLLATVDDLPDPEWDAPSVCTDWARRHVIAHLALNAEGLGGAVRGLLAGEPVPMYRSDDARDRDILALAAEPPDAVRARLQTAAASFATDVANLGSLPPDATFDRTPGGVRMRAAAVPLLRLREVEIHHADLDAGYGFLDWPSDNAAAFLDLDASRHAGTPFTGRATDLDKSWTFGDPGESDPVVSGTAAALAWLASGRDPGDHLTSSTGTLPTVEGR